MGKDYFKIENFIKKYIHSEIYLESGEEYFELKYCASITHVKLNKTIEVETDNELERDRQIIKKKEYLFTEWNTIKFTNATKILQTNDNVSVDDIFEQFKNRIEFETENPIENNPIQIGIIDLKIKQFEFTLLDVERKKKVLEQKLNRICTEALKNRIEKEFWNAQKEIEINRISIENELSNALVEKSKLEDEINIAIKTNNEEWKKKQSIFIKEQLKYNETIDKFRVDYMNHDLNSIIEYQKHLLLFSSVSEFAENEIEVFYNPSNKILSIDFDFPSIDSFNHISERLRNKFFEEVLYIITLKSIYDVFFYDCIDEISAICFNGWVNGINKATGKRENKCILSIQTSKQEFQEIDLQHVDPKMCFKSLKGISASKLSSIISIQPILKIDRKDKRFVDSYDVTTKIDDSTNLAAMNWEDFEHLIREIFEKEFSSNGGEVKVTQASRDGGVDAIAFDPDPIRGGKIVIQAKRYTNTVGVSAVRDLYGTVMNEGATKGILVTTSDYGPDSYEFAKGKPLTLLNGGNLLYLLERHGHKAKIDIEEARRLMKL